MPDERLKLAPYLFNVYELSNVCIRSCTIRYKHPGKFPHPLEEHFHLYVLAKVTSNIINLGSYSWNYMSGFSDGTLELKN